MNVAVAAPAPLARLRAAAAALPALPGGAAWHAWRAAALERVVALGLPTPREDAWKYTNLRLLERRELAPGAPRPVATDVLAAAQLPLADAPAGAVLVFVDGRYAASLSRPSLPPGVAFAPLAELLAREPPQSCDALGPAPGDGIAERIRLLNASFVGDGARIRLEAGTVLAAPLTIVHVATGGAAYPRLVIELDAGAQATLTEYSITAGDGGDSFAAPVSDIRLAAGAALDHYRLQLAGPRAVVLEDTRVELARDARYLQHYYAFGGQLARLDLTARLAGPGASVRLEGLVMADGTRQLDVRTLVEHLVPRTTSVQVYRGVADGRGRGSYDGKVVVHRGAVKSDSSQSTRNLLLSREAAIDTRPQLEINADDVKCGHGATTGALDANMLFYLLSRGLEPDTARALLTFAFAADVIAPVRVAGLRRFLEERVLGRLPAAGLIREFV